MKNCCCNQNENKVLSLSSTVENISDSLSPPLQFTSPSFTSYAIECEDGDDDFLFPLYLHLMGRRTDLFTFL